MMNIVLVDDHKMFLDGLEKLFENHPLIRVDKKFSKPDQVLSYINGNYHRLDLVMTDLNMDEITGMSLIKKIKYKYPKIKVIVCSMYYNHQIIDELKKMDVDGYIHKSFSYKEMTKAIQEVMAGGQYFSPRLSKKALNYDFSWTKSNKLKDNFAKKYYLSKRELEILTLITQNYTSKQIADKIFISVNTVSSHRKNLIKKTGCKTNLDFYLLAIEVGLIKVTAN